jgi:hypothetical protein
MTKVNFPSSVQKTPAIGLPGAPSNLNTIIYTDRNYLSGDDAVTVGNFVWDDPANGADNSGYHGSGVFKALSSGAGKPLGIVKRWHAYVNPDILDGGTLIAPENSPLQVVVKGDLYVVAATPATQGQKVFASLTDGHIHTDAAGATVSGFIETDFVVADGAPVGEVIAISNWR